MQGKGKCNWSDGREYDGFWANNMLNGAGVYTCEDGKRYEGEYVEDKKVG